jgi:tetratricopeptide (TPR) repeat protein
MRKNWPGNPGLLILWARLVQLLEKPGPSLDDARKALEDSMSFDTASPAAAIELGHFLDAVDDDPRAASTVFADAVASARRLLIEGLLGRASVLLQLDKREDAFRCLVEAKSLADPAAELPTADQDAVAARLLAELAAEDDFDRAITNSPDKLRRLSQEALAEYRAGLK